MHTLTNDNIKMLCGTFSLAQIFTNYKWFVFTGEIPFSIDFFHHFPYTYSNTNRKDGNCYGI